MTKSIRFSTLVRNHGPLKKAGDCTGQEWVRAKAERRFFTVYHAEHDWTTPVLGLIGHHGCVNTICKVVFARPVAAGVSQVVGMRNNPDACALVSS